MIRTVQENQTDTAVKEEATKMKIGMYESVIFQHKTMPLFFTVWSNNNLVKTLSNYHTPTILLLGVGYCGRINDQTEKRNAPLFCAIPTAE